MEEFLVTGYILPEMEEKRAWIVIFEAMFFLCMFLRMQTSDPSHNCFCVPLRVRHFKKYFISINEGKILAHSSLKPLS